MTEDVIYQLTKIYLKEIDKEEKFIMSRKDLADFCLKMMKLIRRIESEWRTINFRQYTPNL